MTSSGYDVEVYSTRSESREEKALSGFLTASTDKWVESSYEVEGPLYFGALMTLLGGKEKWMKHRLVSQIPNNPTYKILSSEFIC